MSQPKIRTVLRADLPPDCPHTVRGWSVELNGKVIATCGVMYSYPMQAFSRMEPEMSAYPKTILKLGKQISQICKGCQTKIFAVPDEKYKRSRQFLEHLGFKPVSDELYVFVGDQ